MKTIFLAHIGLIFLSFVLYINASAQIKTAFIGSISNGQPVINDIARATEVIRGSLPASAIPSDIRIFYEQNEHAYYLAAKVTNDPIRFIAIEMTTENSVLCVRSGPGYEILCVGEKCNNCISKTPKGKAICYCTDGNGVQDCSSVAVLTINF
jgi:hypothetical protein